MQPQRHRIEVRVREAFDDPRGQRALRLGRDHLGLPMTAVRTATEYRIAGQLNRGQLTRLRRALTDPVTEESTAGRLPAPNCDWVLRVSFRPGVTDNVARTAEVFARDLLGESVGPLSAATGTLYYIRGALAEADIARLGREALANELIETIEHCPANAYADQATGLELPDAGTTLLPRCEAVVLPQSDDELLALSRSRLLALNTAEMHAIANHFNRHERREQRRAAGLPADPTDVELEVLAQTWSEHCKHKIFAAEVRYREGDGEPETIRSLFKRYIVETTRKVSKEVDWLVSVFDDNAGVVRLDQETNLVFKVETHNSPSALDPYGGAITGIVGVNRDPFGTGRGAALLSNVWGYCFGPPDFDQALPAGLLHPRRIREGVHQGVIDGGNQSGIPYSRGWELFDPRFVGKPLVFCGTVGTMPATLRGQPAETKTIEPGDHIVMVGGRIGKDGIHGATFSSEALSESSPAQAVQIGDAITQKLMFDMLLEARDQGLYRAITDNGAGGLSSSVGEMAQLCGGAQLELDKAPLKYSGLMPWEIIVSEAQERMTLAVPPEQLDALLALAARREVEATAIGRFDNSGHFRASYAGKPVLDLSMDFLHGGCPTLQLNAHWRPRKQCVQPESPPTARPDLRQLLLDTLKHLNHCAKSDWSRQYDHEVKGLSVIKPLVGVSGDVPSDATVMRVKHGSDRAVLLSEAVAPALSDWDPGVMGAYVVDLAVRRIVAAGGRLGYIAGLDNFCWPDPVQSEQTPDGEQKLAGLVRCCRELSRLCCGLSVPLISGKDSMKNDTIIDGEKISIPETLLFSTIAWIDDASRAIDLVIPDGPHGIYLLGQTRAELAGATLLGDRPGLFGVAGAPEVDARACRQVCAVTQQAIERGWVSAAHAPQLGGLALALAYLCLAAGRGLEVTLDPIATGERITDAELLFSTSASRMLLAVPIRREDALREQLVTADLPWARIGQNNADKRLVCRRSGRTVVDTPLSALREAYAGGSRQ